MKSAGIVVVVVILISRLFIHTKGFGADFKRGVGDLEEKLVFSVEEGLPAGTVIGKIDKKPGYNYKLNEQNAYFTFDGNTGEIRTLSELDREALSDDRIDLLIVANSPTYFITVSINVKDANDNYPTFPFPYQNVSIAESARLGARLALAGARDYDRGDNGLITAYQIIGGENEEQQPFRLITNSTSTSSVGNDGSLALELIKSLDRESRSLYVLNISATDNGKPAKTGYTTVFVNVLDSNDNAPVFDRAQYYVSANENSPVGLALLSVSATDRDINDNGRLTYKLSNDPTNQFRINPQTGLIDVVKSPLNCPLQNCASSSSNCTRICIFTAEARDSGSPAQIGRAFVNVRLVDENNNAPEISFRYYPPGADFASVEESKPPGTVIAVVTATDADAGDNGRVVVSIVTGDDYGHFRLETNDLFSTIRTNATLNKFKIPSYNLTVLAHDFGKPPKYTSKMLRVFVADANDEPPVFQRAQYLTEVYENSPRGSYVAAVRATGGGKGRRTIVYSIVSGDTASGMFRINNVTGLITTWNRLDYELIQNVTLVVNAKYDQPSLNSSETRIFVNVIDRNDNAPEFEKTHYNASVYENATVGTQIITVRAIDKDSGKNGAVSYSFVDGRNISVTGHFGVDTKTGIIYLASNLDRESVDFYKLSIRAYDSGSPSLSNLADVVIYVEDINDRSPYFYPTEYYVNLRKDSPPGAFVAKVRARDEDAGRFGELDYYIRQAPIGAFDLDSKTGLLTLKRLPFGRNRADIVLGAKDGGGLTSDNNATIHVFVTDNSDSRPKFVKPTYEFLVDEDNSLASSVGVRNGRVIGSVSVTDKDDVQYQIADGDPLEIFSIGQYSGELRSVKTLDYELKSQFRLTVVAITSSGISSSSIGVSLNDLNDNVPTFDKRYQFISLDRNHPAGEPFYYGYARDADSGLNGTIRYSLLNANASDFFVDPTSGIVSPSKPAFLLSNEKYNLTLTASDSGVPSLHSSIQLIISLTGSHNSTRSLFLTPFLQYNVLETTPVNSLLFNLNVSYTGAADIFYESVQSSPLDLFDVFPDGKIYIKNNLDYETAPFFTSVIRGTVNDERGSPLFSSTAVVYFQIFDENDNTPICTNDTYTFYVPEGAQPLTYVGTVEARDADGGLNSLVSYRFSDSKDNSYFFIDSSSGVISTAIVFDREEPIDISSTGSVIKLKVEAYDHGLPVLSTICPVDIVITDINDNAPVFGLDLYTARVFEDVEINSQILQFSATDNDEKENAQLHYQLINGNLNDTFWLNETSGQLFVRKPLDRETVDNYHLTVFVSDAGNSPLNSTAFAAVTVLDINDNAPKFRQFPTEYRLSENMEIGSVFATLSAEDYDEGLAGSVKYYLQAGNVDRTFEIDEVTGDLKLIKSLDYESMKNYSLSIAAADGSAPGLSSQIQINILVSDENDNAPVVNGSTLLGKVYKNAPAGTVVTTVSAFDADSGSNGRMTFSIMDQVPRKAFAMDSSTGLITVDSSNVGYKTRTYKLLIEVADLAENTSARMSTQRFVDIIVTDLSDSLTIYDGPRAGVVNPSTKTDYKILSLKSSYQILTSDDDLFMLSPEGGLYLKRPAKPNKPYYRISLDRKDSSKFNAQKMYDQRLLLQTRSVQPAAYNNNSTLDVIILVSYRDNIEVKFDKDVYTFEAPENIPVGTEIGRVKASSGATGHKLEYYVTNVRSELHNNNLPLLVDVDAYSGSLRVERPLVNDDDPNGIAQFSMDLYAVDVESAEPRSGSCTVTIKILKAKDTPPKFTEDLYEFRLSENAPVGTVIGIVTLSNNSSFDRIEYSLENRTDLAFNVNPKTGLITSRYLLDRDIRPVHTLLVTASDGVYWSGTFIRIILNDVNDNAPIFVKDNYHFRVHENSERNSFVGVVRAIDQDFGPNGTVEYEFEYVEFVSEFSLDSTTGVITVNGVIDAEKQPLYVISVLARDQGIPPKQSKIKIYIEVLDLNDNQPYLTQNTFELKVFENITVGSQLMQLSPLDLDSETNFSYAIESGDPWRQFRLDGNGTLIVVKQLDRETRVVHHLRVTVYDAPSTVALRRSCSAEIAVTLLDVNDNAPRIVSSNIALAPENSPNGTLVTVLVAVDEDQGSNATTLFGFDPRNFGVPPFAVDPVSGRVTVNGPLDRETTRSYRLIVFAYDQETPFLRSYFNLTVILLDADDNRPKFVERYIELSVTEDLSVGQSLLQLGATDNDSTSENTVSKFWIAEGDVNNDFTVGPDTGLLYVAHPLNYERSNAYNLTIAVADLETATASDKATVILNVADVNDNAPTFSRAPIRLSVAENFAQTPIVIGRASAIDPDSGLNGKLSYSITQGNISAFSIDSLNGDIKVNGPLDRELQDVYKLIVQVSDSGTPRLSGSAEIIVRVIDLNDNAPRFENSEYFVDNVLENQPSGTVVCRVFARDEDVDENGIVEYSLIFDDEIGLPFSIDEQTGVIRTRSALDREFRNVWNFTAVARDRGPGAPLESFARVIVKVGDQNDNAPVIRNARQDVFLKSPSAKGEFVYAVDAYDLDEGANGRLKYSMSGKDSSYFEIDQSTGVIISKYASATQDSYAVDVTITDGGSPPLQTSISYRLFFSVASGNFPSFVVATSNGTAATVKEDAAIGAVIGSVTARSSKSAPFNRIVYGILAGNTNSAFDIDPDSGAITVSSSSGLDYELTSHYELWISASDNDNPPLTSFLRFSIRSTDVNDNAPRFTKSSYTFRVLEEEMPPVILTDLRAIDPDSGDNGRIEYSLIVTPAYEDYFEIDKTNGRLSTLVQIDREKNAKFEFTVVAKDRGRPALSGTASVVVLVDDINDNAPKFSRLFSASVREDAVPGDFVTLVTSSDADSPENSNNTYYLAVNPSRRFAIDPYTGNVTVATELDRESESEYQLKVVAVDGAWRVETSLLVTVLDVNDNAPNFAQSIYMFNISEMQPVNTVIGRVTATDLDGPGANSKIRYKLKDKMKFFTVDAVNGQLKSSSVLKYRKSDFNANFYRFTVIGQDYGKPSLSSSTVVVVRILEVNKGSPIFDKSLYKFSIPKTINANAVIGRVRAIDTTDTVLNAAKLSYRFLNSTDFSIDPVTGIIHSANTLSNDIGREYRLTVAAYDHGNPSKSASSEIVIISSGPNLNNPKFTSASYGATLSEDSSPNTFVLKLEARDADDGLNGEIKYLLDEVSAASKLFSLNETSGVLTLNGPLDYETVTEYNLRVYAIDGGYESKNGSALIHINVRDVDDNPPKFQNVYFECHVSENVNEGTRICRVEAVDADSSPFDKIFYSFCSNDDSDEDEIIDRSFAINPETGDVYTNGIIDYETKTVYRYKVCASGDRDADASDINNAALTIFVDGVNEFWPKFDQPNYRLIIPANALPDSQWSAARASDKDLGADGIVYYFPDNSHFIETDSLSIETKTGSFVVGKNLAIGTANKTFSFNVGAKNGKISSIKELDFAQITVQIGIDYFGPPTFSRSLYYVSVAENSITGTSLLSLSATGYGAGRILYKISNNSLGANVFSIDAKTGLLKVSGRIDRESVDLYSLTVFAYYDVDPSVMGSCTVSITVTDVNDNAPYLSPARSYGRILEGSPIGANVSILMPEDKDIPPNTYPYNMSLIYDSRESSMFELDSNTGILKTKAVFDREIRNRYDLSLLIADNGRPQQSATVKFTVLVDDINDNPSVSKPLDVTAYVYDDTDRFIGSIGPINPADIDSVGDYECEIMHQSVNSFAIDSGCSLISSKKIDLGLTYSLTVKGTDGVHDWVDYNVTVKLNSISNSTLNNAVIIDLISIREYPPISIIEDLSKFVSKRGHSMKILSYSRDSIFRIRLAFVVTDQRGEEMSAELAAKLLTAIEREHNETVNFYIERTDYGSCYSSPCKNGGRCSDIAFVDNANLRTYLEIDRKLYSYANLRRKFACQCAEGFAGKRCEVTVDRCAVLHCQNGATCQESSNTGQTVCLCPPGYEGESCQNDINECNSAANLCKNGGYCENTNGSYKCICMVGFSGPNCLHSSDTCASEPCFNDGVCEKTSTNDYRCLCKFGFSGRNCEISSLGFDQLSFVELKPLSTVDDFYFSVEFATLQRNALLLHLFGKSHFLVFDIVDDNLRFRLSSTDDGRNLFELKLPQQKVNDGKWYMASFTLNSKFASLSVGLCSSVDNVCDLCSLNESRCKTKKDVNLSGLWPTIGQSNFFVGSLKSLDEIRNIKRGVLSSINFVGCLRNIVVNNRSIDDHGIVDKSNIIDHCPRSNESPCAAKNSCRDGETCTDAWSKPMCRCKGGYSATNCEEAEIGSTFSGYSFVAYKLTEAYRRKLLTKSILSLPADSVSQYRNRRSPRRAEHWLSFEFRTTARDGLLFFAASGDDFSLIDISNDTIRYMSKVADSTPTQVILNRDFSPSDGEWHTVFLNLFDDARTVELNVDDRGKETTTAASVHVFLSPALSSTSVGGAAQSVKVFGVNLPTFSGCLRRFIVDGVLQPLDSGYSEFFEATSKGEIAVGCAGSSLRCVSPPCTAAPLPAATVNAGVAAVLVFFVCLIASTVVAYLVVRRIRRRKALSAATPEPNPNLNKPENGFESMGNLNGSSKDSGIVVGDSREVLDRCSSDLSTTAERRMAPCYSISNPIIQNRFSSNTSNYNIANNNINNRFWDDRPIYSTPERYDLDNASSIAPSDTDVVYHYRGYRDPVNKRPASVHSKVLRNSATSSTVAANSPMQPPPPPPPPAPSSLKSHQRSSRRSTPMGGGSRPSSIGTGAAGSPSTSSEEEDMRRSRRAPSTKSARSKRRTASSPRKSASLKRKRKSQQNLGSECASTPLSSVKRGDYRFRSNPQISDDDEDDGEYPDDSPPALPPRTFNVPRPRPADSVESDNANFEELDLDAVRKPRNLTRPDSSAAETETESDINGVYGSATGPVTLAAFRVGPRSMFPVSEDESDFSINRRPPTNSRHTPERHNLEAYV